MIPRDVVASGDPAKIRSYLEQNSLVDLPVEVRDLTREDFENFNRVQGERSAEVQRGLSDLTNDQGVSPFAQAVDESPLPRLLGSTGVPGVLRSIREAATAGESQGGFIGGLSKLALAVTPDWDIGRRFAEATGATTGKTMEQLLRGVGQAASLTGSAAIAGADANLPGTTSGLMQGLAGHALRSGGRWLTDMMDVPGPQDLGEVGETYRRAGFLPAALATGELMARGITENAPQMAAGALFPPLAVSPEAAPIIHWLANLAPFAVTAIPQETGDIYERAIDEGRQGPQAALAALAGGGINALLEAGPEAFQVGHLLGQQVKDELRRAATRGTGGRLMDGLMTSLKSTRGEAWAEMAQEGVGYGAERAGGAEPSTVPELLNRIGTAGVMALGMGGAMGVPAGASHVQSINRFAEGQARIPQIQQRLGQLQQMREELLRMRDAGTEELQDAQGRAVPVDYVLGQLDQQIAQGRITEAEHISAFGDTGIGAPPVAPPIIGQTADQATADAEARAAKKKRVRVQPEPTATEVTQTAKPEPRVSFAEEPTEPAVEESTQDQAEDTQELPQSLQEVGAMQSMEELQAAPIELVENAANDLARIGGQRINEGRPIHPGDPEHQLAQILRDELARREALPADHPANQRQSEAVAPESPAVPVAELRAKIERANRARRVKIEEPTPTRVAVQPTPATATETDAPAEVRTTESVPAAQPAPQPRVSVAEPATGTPASPTIETMARRSDELAEARKWQKSKPPTRLRMLRNKESTLNGLTYEEADRVTREIIVNAEKPGKRTAAEPPRASSERSAAIAEQTAQVTGALPDGSPAALVAAELGGQIADARESLKADLTDLTLRATKTLNVVEQRQRSTPEILMSVIRNIMRLGHLKFRAVALRVREELAKAHGRKVAEDMASLEQLKRAYLAVTRALSPAARAHVSTPAEVAGVTVLPPPTGEQVQPETPAAEEKPATKKVQRLKFDKQPREARADEEVTDRKISDDAFQAWSEHELKDVKEENARGIAMLAGMVQAQLGLPLNAQTWKRTIPPGYAKIGDRLVLVSKDPSITSELSEKDQRNRDTLSGKKFTWASDMGWSGLGERATQSLKLGARESGGTLSERTLKAIGRANEKGGADDQRVEKAQKRTEKARKKLEGIDRLTDEVGPVVIDLSADGFVNDRLAVTDEAGKTTSVDSQSHQLESALKSITDEGTDSPSVNAPIPVIVRPHIEGEITDVERTEGKNPKILSITVRITGGAGEAISTPGVEVVGDDGDDLIVQVSPMRLLNPDYMEALGEYDRAIVEEIHARRMRASHSRILLRQQRGDSQFEGVVEIPQIDEEKLAKADSPEKAARVLRAHQQKLMALRREIADGTYVADEDRTISIPFSLEALDHALIELDDRIAQLMASDFIGREALWMASRGISQEALMELMGSAMTAERDDTGTARSRIGAIPAPDDAEMERLNAMPESKGMNAQEKLRWKYARLRLKFREPARQVLRLNRELAELRRTVGDAEVIAAKVAERQKNLDLLNDVALRRQLDRATSDYRTATRALDEATSRGEDDADVMDQLRASVDQTKSALDQALKTWNEESNESSSARADAIAIGQHWMGNSSDSGDSHGDSYGVSGMNVGPADRGRRMRRLMAGLPTRTRVKALWYGTELARSLEQPKGPWRQAFRKAVQSEWNSTVGSVRTRNQREIMDDLNALAVAVDLVAHHYHYDEGAGIPQELRSAGILYGLVKRSQRHLVHNMEVRLADLLIGDSGEYFSDVAGRQAETRNAEADHSKPENRPYYQLPSPVPIADAAAVDRLVRPLVEPNWRAGEEQRTSASVSRKWAVLRIGGNADGTQGELVFLPVKWAATNGQEKGGPVLRIRAPFNLGGQERRKGNMVAISDLAAAGGVYGRATVVGMVTLSPQDATDRFPLGDHPVHQWSIQPVLDQWHARSESLGVESEGAPMDLSRISDRSDPSGVDDEIDRTAMGSNEPSTAPADIDAEVRENAVEATRRLLAYIGERMHLAGMAQGSSTEGVRRFLLDLISEPDSRFVGALTRLYDALTTAGSAPNGGTLLGQQMTEGVFYDQFFKAINDAANDYADDAEASGQPDETGGKRRRSFSADPVAGLGAAVARRLGVSAASGALPASDTIREAGAPAARGISQSESDILRGDDHPRSDFQEAARHRMEMSISRFLREAGNPRWMETAQNQPRRLIVNQPQQIEALERVFGGSNEAFPTIPEWWRISPLRGGGYEISDYRRLGLELIRPQKILPRPIVRSENVAPQVGQRVGPYLTEEERQALPVDEEAAARYGREYQDQLRRSREQLPAVAPAPRLTGRTGMAIIEEGKPPQRVKFATFEEGGRRAPANPDVYGAPPMPSRVRIGEGELRSGTPRAGQNVVAEPESPETVASNRRMSEILRGSKKNESRTTETQGAPQPGRTPLTEDEVAGHVRDLLDVAGVPPHIQIVDGLTGKNGEQIAGDYDPSTGEFRINRRLTYDRMGVARVLVHEATHSVFDDPAVAEAMAELRQRLPEDIRRMVDALYGDLPESGRSEEGTVNLVERIYAEAPKNLLDRLWRAIVDALSRNTRLRKLLEFLGVDTTGSLGRQVAAHALVAAARPVTRGVSGQRESRMIIDGEEALTKAKASADATGKAELERQAAVQAATVPEWVPERIRGWMAPVGRVSRKNPQLMMDMTARRRAARSLNWLVRLSETTDSRTNVDRMWADAQAMPENTEEERDAKARAQQQAIVGAVTVLDVQRKVLYELQRSEEELQKAQEDLDQAIDGESEANARDRTRSIATVETMIQDLSEWSESRDIAEGEDPLSEEQWKAVEGLADIEGARDDFGLLVNRLFDDPDVRVILEDQNTTDEQKLQQLLGGPIPLAIAGSKELTQSEFIRRIMSPSLPGRNTPVALHISLPSQLAEIQALRQSRDLARQKIEDITRRYRSSSPKGELDLRKFSAKLVREAEKLGEAKHIRALAYQKVRQANIRVFAAARKIQLLEQMSLDPAYREHVRQAFNLGRPVSSDILITNRSGTESPRDPSMGKIGTEERQQNLPPNSTSLVMPDTGETLIFRHSFRRDEDEKMRQQVQQALRRIGQWVANVDAGAIKDVNPTRVEEYRGWVTSELLSMLDPGWAVAGNQTWGTIISAAFHGPQTAHQMLSVFGPVLDPITTRLGTQAGRELRRDIAGFSRMTSESYGLLSEIHATEPAFLEAGAKSHGIKLDPNSEAPLRAYYLRVINPIVAQGQWNRQRQLKVGDTIVDWQTGQKTQVTAEDLRLVMLLKRWHDRLRETVENPGSALERRVQVEVPGGLVSRGQQGPQTQRTVTQGTYTTSRTPSPELRELLDWWNEGMERLPTRGTSPAGENTEAAAEMHWQKFFADDPSTGRPKDQRVWGRLLVPHLLTDDPDYIGHNHRKIGDLYDELRAALHSGWEPRTSREILEKLGRALKRRDLQRLQDRVDRLRRSSAQGTTPRALLEAMEELQQGIRKTDQQWQEEGRVHLANDIEHSMNRALGRWNPNQSNREFISRVSRDEFSTPRGALLVPSTLMSHLPIDQGAQNMQVAAAVEHFMNRLKNSIDSAIRMIGQAIEEHEASIQEGMPIYTGEGKRNGEIMHTVRELQRLRSALSAQATFIENAMAQTFDVSQGVGQWLNLLIRGGSSVVLNPLTNAPAVTRDVVVTSGVFTPLATLGLGNGFTGVVLAQTQNLARATAGVARRLASTKVGRKLGQALPMVAQMAVAYERNRAALVMHRLAEHRMGLETVMESIGGPASSAVARRRITEGRAGAFDERLQQGVRAVTQWLYGMRVGAEEATNLLSALEGWKSQTRKIKRNYRRAIERRQAMGIDVTDAANPGFGITGDELFDHHLVTNMFFNRKDSLRNLRDLFAETRGLDLELRDWYERTRWMSEEEALKTDLNDLAETATARRWVSMYVRPSVEQLSTARLAKGPLGKIAMWGGMHKGSIFAVRASFGTHFGRTTDPNPLTRNLKVLGGTTLGLIATALAMALAYEVPRLEKKLASGGVGSSAPSAVEALEGPEVLGRYLSQVVFANTGLFPSVFSLAIGANLGFDPMSLSDQMFGMGVVEDLLKAGAKAGSGHFLDAGMWLARRRVPLINHLMFNVDGSADATSLYRAYNRLAPEGLERERQITGTSLSVQSQESLIAREAANARIAGDDTEADRLEQQLTDLLMEKGPNYRKARSDAQSKIANQMPMRRALKRRPTMDEQLLLMQRMNPYERQLMEREIDINRRRSN